MVLPAMLLGVSPFLSPPWRRVSVKETSAKPARERNSQRYVPRYMTKPLSRQPSPGVPGLDGFGPDSLGGRGGILNRILVSGGRRFPRTPIQGPRDQGGYPLSATAGTAATAVAAGTAGPPLGVRVSRVPGGYPLL